MTPPYSPPVLQSTTRLNAATLVRRLGEQPWPEDGPAYRQLAGRIRSALLDGRIAVHSGLPSERDLAAGLAMSRTTVAAAYALLREQGWLESRRGSGSRLRLPERPLSVGAVDPVRAVGASLGGTGIFGFPDLVGEDLVDLSTACLPAPRDHLLGAVAAATARLQPYLAGDGYNPFGLPLLRQAIANRYTAAGVTTTAEQILITNGAQHALSLVLRELSDIGDRVLVECPTYPVALDAIRAARRVPAPIGVGPSARSAAEGAWDSSLIASTLRQIAPRLAYLTPDFQNPTGALMDEQTRQRLVADARATGTLLLIDESFRDIPFDAADPLPPAMATFGDPTRVITFGSVSKSFWGGLRIGWIRAAAPIIDRLALARSLGDMSGAVLDQLIVAEWLADPEPALAVQRSRLAAGAAALHRSLAEHLPHWRPSHPRGGACLWVGLPGPYASELARLATRVGVRLAPGPRFGPDGTMESFLRLPFTLAPDRLAGAVQRIVAVDEEAATARTSAMPSWLA